MSQALKSKSPYAARSGKATHSLIKFNHFTRFTRSTPPPKQDDWIGAFGLIVAVKGVIRDKQMRFIPVEKQ